MRTTASQALSARAMADELVRRRFPRERAERIVDIAGTFGIKAEAVPGGGVVTVQLVPGRRGTYTITDKMVT